MSSTVPTYSYTLGLLPQYGFEVLLPGQMTLLQPQRSAILNAFYNEMAQHGFINAFDCDGIEYQLKRVHPTWSSLLMIGVQDYFGIQDFESFCIVPLETGATIDLPNVTITYRNTHAGCWRWLTDPWTYTIPRESTVTTNISALHGESILELVRVDTDEWEAFSVPSPNLDVGDVRVIPIGVLLASDKTLMSATELMVDTGLYRDDGGSPWVDWA